VATNLTNIKLQSLFKFYSFIINLPVWPFIFLMVFLTYLVEIPLLLIEPFFEESAAQTVIQTFIKMEPGLALLIVGVFGPLVETAIFQTLIIGFLQKIKIRSNLIIILISAVLFSLAHAETSIPFHIWVFIFGVILAYSYILYQDKKEESFAVAFFIHSFRNIISMFVVLAG